MPPYSSPRSAPPSPRKRNPLLLFAKNFLKHPLMLGAITPSSRMLAEKMLDHLDWDKADIVVEYGPGSGAVTKSIIKRLHPKARLILIELNTDFLPELHSLTTDPRIQLIHGSALDVQDELKKLGLGQADIIISGVPLSTMPPPIARKLIDESHTALRPGGKLVMFQYTTLALALLRKRFASCNLKYVLANLPPAFVFTACKQGESAPKTP